MDAATILARTNFILLQGEAARRFSTGSMINVTNWYCDCAGECSATLGTKGVNLLEFALVFVFLLDLFIIFAARLIVIIVVVFVQIDLIAIE